MESKEQIDTGKQEPEPQDLILKAEQYKAEGNVFYKAKDYQKAISKYSRVQCFTQSYLPSQAGADSENIAGMIQKQQKVSEDDKTKALEIQASAYLNMSICFFLQKKYEKSIEKATLSLKLQKSIKGFYRRGKAYTQLGNIEKAIEDMRDAVKMDPSDPNDIQQELVKLRAKEKAAENKRLQKLSGFLLNAEDKEKKLDEAKKAKEEKTNTASQSEDQFNFDDEIKEYIDQNLIKSIDFTKKDQAAQEAVATIVTLEGTSIEINWTVANGIQVTKVSDYQKEDVDKDELKKTFEGFEGLLSEYSPKYREKFSQKLMDKLKNVQMEQQ